MGKSGGRKMKVLNSDNPVIISGGGSLKLCVSALRKGAGGAC